MKYRVHIERLVVDRGLAEPRLAPARVQQIAQAVRLRLVQSAPIDGAADAGASLEAGIAAAVGEALARRGTP
jgi:hypothetical protein